jgi:hypothetical protein
MRSGSHKALTPPCQSVPIAQPGEDMVLREIIAVGIGIWEHRRKEARRSVCQERELRRMLRRVMDEAARREQELKKSLRQDMVADLCIAHTSVQRSLCRRQGRGLWSRVREA